MPARHQASSSGVSSGLLRPGCASRVTHYGRSLAIVLLTLFCAGCGPRTPGCSDPAVAKRIQEVSLKAIEDALLRVDRKVSPSPVVSRLAIEVASVSSGKHDRGIDKWTCSAELRIALPSQIAEFNDHPVFKAIAPKQKVTFAGDRLAVPIDYTVYRTEKNELAVSPEGIDVAVRYIQGVYRAGIFGLDLKNLPDLHAGMALYSGREKHVLFRPVEDGKIQFDFAFDKPACHPWSQHITQERGDMMMYDNPKAGCMVLFARLGELLVVEHKGCELMNAICLPDGTYRKQ
jgi:hypothetical protein